MFERGEEEKKTPATLIKLLSTQDGWKYFIER